MQINETMSLMSDIMRHNQQHPEMTPTQSLQALATEYTTQQAQNAANMQQAQAVGPHQNNMQQTPQQPNMNMPPNGNPHPGMQGGNVPQGARTPSGAAMQHPNAMNVPPNFVMSSPALQNSLLPGGMQGVNGGGSPRINLNAANVQNAHTPSPAQTHMQAPAMAHQLSQQGSIGGSSGASVNTSPNVTGNGKRRRPSNVKTEDDGGGVEVNGVQPKVKQSPRVGGQNKRIKS